jgi:hypothetical protein
VRVVEDVTACDLAYRRAPARFPDEREENDRRPKFRCVRKTIQRERDLERLMGLPVTAPDHTDAFFTHPVWRRCEVTGDDTVVSESRRKTLEGSGWTEE